MNFKQSFLTLSQGLKSFYPLWSREVLNSYPQSLADYPEEWIEQLLQLNEDELYRLDGRGDISSLGDSSLGRYITELREQLPKFTHLKNESPEQLPSWAFFRVKEKKKHEIDRIRHYLNQAELSFKRIIDIGGGVGHLSRVLAHYHGHHCHTLDINRDFQEIGAKRAKKYPIPAQAGKLHFHHLAFGEDVEDLRPFFTTDSLALGLHTCGNLANHLIFAFNHFKNAGLINFGCCYHRLNPERDINLSAWAKVHGLPMSNHALTLATRGHTEMTFKEFLLKKRVKAFRYALHLYLFHERGITDFLSVGDEHARVYHGDFSIYALKKMGQISLDPLPRESELNLFFAQEKVQHLINKMFMANLIRWQWGRNIECYLLLDRALWLQEKGHQVDLVEFFDETLSPRNIALIARPPIYAG